MDHCQLCGGRAVEPLLDLGAHPSTSALLVERDQAEPAYGIAVAQCATCGLMQLTQPWPHEALIPRFEWMTYREPEDHLDGVVDTLMALLPVGSDGVVAGITTKDDTMLERFRQREGIRQVWRLDYRNDLELSVPHAGIESVQHAVTPHRLASVVDRRGPADLVIVRHILEHAEDIQEFLAGVATLVRSGGLLMLEVPDCTTGIAGHDYTMIWEEHSVYFTPETFFSVLARHGFTTVHKLVVPYRTENCLILIARKTGDIVEPIWPLPTASLANGRAYAADFQSVTARLQALFADYRLRGGIALYGAGHLTASFLNYHGLAEHVSFVVDDTPQKQGLFVPGARLPVVSSAVLAESGVMLCLLGLAPEHENKVIARNSAFIAQGGVFRSIFAGSRRAIHELFLPFDGDLS
jgi:hypothetical protein